MKINNFTSLVRKLAKLTVAITWLLKAIIKLVGVADDYSTAGTRFVRYPYLAL